MISRSIPPSSGTKEAIRNRNIPVSGNGRQRGSSGKKLQMPLSKNWMWINAICLFLNISLMVTIFFFHANWMPRASSSVMRAHAKNRKEMWKLLRGDHQEEAAAEAAPVKFINQEIPAHDTNGQKLPPAAAAAAAAADGEKIEEQELPFTPNNSPNDDSYDVNYQQYHIIFSTGCSVKQHWQSYQLFYSMVTSGQKGQVTRIASGCSDEEATELGQIHEEQILPMGLIGQDYEGKSRFHLHMTPEFGEGFHYNNKPYGVSHWLENVLGYGENTPSTKHDDTIIFLLDPDMIMMRPFVNDFTKNEMWVPRTSFPHIDRIKHGFPMASEYGFGNQWYHKTNITKIVNDSPITKMTTAEIDENYHAGPPYIATAKDFYKIASRWRFLAQPVHEQYPYLLSEMFAYSLAAADLKLPHQLARSFMVSDWREPGLDLVTKNDNIRTEQMCRNVPTEYKPHVLHYCQRLALGKYIMSKHRYPEDFVGQQASCSKPLLAEPPDDVALKYDFFVDVQSGQRHDIRDAKNGGYKQQEKINQAAFMLCEEIQAFNRGATYFKEHHCNGNANMEKTFMFFYSTELTEKEKQQEGKVV